MITDDSVRVSSDAESTDQVEDDVKIDKHETKVQQKPWKLSPKELKIWNFTEGTHDTMKVGNLAVGISHN